MTPLQKAKIARFLEDSLLADTVKQILEDGILSGRVSGAKSLDVNFLAAERIALDILREAWEDLRKYKSEVEEKEVGEQNNVGL